MGAPQGNNDEI